MSDLKNVSTTGAFMGNAGKLGLAIQGQLRNNHRYTKEVLEDYNEAVAFLKSQNSELYNDFDNDDARVCCISLILKLISYNSNNVCMWKTALSQVFLTTASIYQLYAW